MAKQTEGEDEAAVGSRNPDRRTLMKGAGAIAAMSAIPAALSAPDFAQGASAWDKTFPRSARVDHQKVTFKNRYGVTLAADLYLPKNRAGGRSVSAQGPGE